MKQARIRERRFAAGGHLGQPPAEHWSRTRRASLRALWEAGNKMLQKLQGLVSRCVFLPMSRVGNLWDSASYSNQAVSTDIKSTALSCFAEQELASSFICTCRYGTVYDWKHGQTTTTAAVSSFPQLTSKSATAPLVVNSWLLILHRNKMREW